MLTELQVALLLPDLKMDIGISSKVYDERLMRYLESAEAEIVKEGVKTLEPESPGDRQLIIMYAAWKWRCRDKMEGMPRMIRYALNNRVFSEKARGDLSG